MKNNKHKIFLLISLIVFTASVTSVVLYYCEAKSSMDRILSESPDTQLRFGLEFGLMFGIFFTLGALGLELSFIRSVYKTMKHKPNGWIGACYVASAVLAFLTIVFYSLCLLNVIDLVSDSGRDYTGDVYLLTLWPAFVISFILGSIPVGCDRERLDPDSTHGFTLSNWVG